MFTMKVHTSSAKKRNSLNQQRPQHGVVSSNIPTSNTKKLWRLPHVFANVLELPLHSDADVSVEETPHFLRFVASCDDMNTFITAKGNGGVKAHAIEILPGMTKIVIKGMDGRDFSVVPPQRFRLPAWTRPEMATAVCSGGKLAVMVPKSRGN